MHYSLQETKTRFPFLLLSASKLSRRTLNTFEANKIAVKFVEPIVNPFKRGETNPNWKHTYSKLRIFEQREFDKIVYLDADMLICKNIDELFDKPHMSAVNAGGMLPELSSWVQLGSCVMVIEPAKGLDAGKMLGKAMTSNQPKHWQHRPWHELSRLKEGIGASIRKIEIPNGPLFLQSLRLWRCFRQEMQEMEDVGTKFNSVQF
jgi:hypothetical protein